MRGKFIVFEGVDGCGKGTQLEKAKDYLSNKGYNLFLVREPGGTEVSEGIREMLLNPIYRKMIPIAELFLYEATRAQLVREVIKPNLERGMWGLGDRFAESSIAYQGFGRKIDIHTILWVNKYATDGLVPDLTFVFDVPVEVSLQRRRKDPDRIEREGREFYDRVRSGYLALPEICGGNIKIIDGTKSVDDVFQETKKYIEKIL